MSQIDSLVSRTSLILSLIFGLTALHTTAQERREASSHPPTSFGMEDDKFPNAVPLPACVHRLLANDDSVVNTLKYEELSPEELPDDWFTASERELGQRNDKLLVVMGVREMMGANITPFWIFRKLPKSCQLLLNVGAHDLEILDSTTNGLPDIKIASATAIRYGENEFRFDGRGYREIRRTSQPIGEEIPDNLSNFEARKPLVQGVSQNPEPVLSEARAWLWKQWWLEKPSYIKITLHSKEGDETTTTYFIRKNAGRLDVLIRRHSVFVERSPHRLAGHPRVEDEILVATDVERRQALKDNPDRTTIVPEDQEAAPDSYELYFIDDSGNTVVIV